MKKIYLFLASVMIIFYAIPSAADSNGPGPVKAGLPANNHNPSVFSTTRSVTSIGCTKTVLVNDGSTSGNARAPQTRNRYERSVYLIKASELAAAGYHTGATPTTIGWNYQTGGTAGSAPLTIYMQNTADVTNLKSTTWATAITGMTTVHNATTALPAAAGAFDITLTGGSAFTYTGGGLYIAFDWGQYAATLGTTTVVWCNSTGLAGGLLGAQSNASAPTTLAASNFRPETRLDGDVLPATDAGVTTVASYGELPRGLVPAQVIKSVVTNNSGSTLTNVSVTLNVTGANSFTNTQVIPSMTSCGGQGTVTFASYTPSASGNDAVAVTVPADDVSTNNSVSDPVSVNSLNYSYKYPGTTASGGVGLTGVTGAFLSKFTLTGANAVTDVKLEFPAIIATTYRIIIYGDNAGVPSLTALYTDAADRTVTVAGPVTITLPAPVVVGPGNFYVGIQQTNTTNAGLSYDAETPIRSGSFFIATPLPVTAWSDFSPGNNFKLNIGLILQTPTVVPVAILNFSGYKDGTNNQLRWTTATEQNNRGFELQRSADGVNFTDFGFVNSKATGGNSTAELNYAYTDNNINGKRPQYYRLRQTNFDGNSKLSNIVLINGDKPTGIEIDGFFPNPPNSLVNVLIAAPDNDKLTLVVTDIAGRKMIEQAVSVQAGSNTIPVDINRLTRGTYMVKLVCANGCDAAVGKFVKQ